LDEYFTDEARLCVILSNLEANYTFKLGKVLVILPVALCELLNLNLCSIRIITNMMKAKGGKGDIYNHIVFQTH